MLKIRKITAYFLFSLFVIMVVLVPSFSANPNNVDYEWVTEYVRSEKYTFEKNEHVAALVNGHPIPSSEVSRRVVNMKILLKMQLDILEKAGLSNYDKATLQGLIERYKLEYEKQGSPEMQLRELIFEELLFQESRKTTPMVDYQNAFEVEKELYSMMSEKEKAPLEKYAQGLGLTPDEYIQKYLVPLRQRKLTINQYLESMLESGELVSSATPVDKGLSLEELKEFLFVKAVIHYNP